MKPKNDQSTVLERLRREGQITDVEYQRLLDGSRPPKTAGELGEHHAHTEETVVVDSNQVEPLFEPKLRNDVSIQHVGSILVAAIGLITISSLGLLSWLTAIGAILVLAATLIEDGTKIALTGGVAVALLTLFGFAASAEESPESDQNVTVTSSSENVSPDAPGSLGLHMDEVTDAWNTVEGGPRITRGLTRYNESGDYDTFIYRFGEWGRLAGAFDPDSETVYALLAAGRLSQDATDQLYLHLCFMVAPYSQECVDAYLEAGLGGGSLEDFADVAHAAEWKVGEHTWRLEIDQNVMVIRVFGADAA